MNLAKLLSDEVSNDYTPLSQTVEGLLQGGFGSIIVSGDSCDAVSNNCFCGTRDNCSCPSYQQTKPTNNCSCPSSVGDLAPIGGNNCTCANGSEVNNCSCMIKTSTKSCNASTGLISVIF